MDTNTSIITSSATAVAATNVVKEQQQENNNDSQINTTTTQTTKEEATTTKTLVPQLPGITEEELAIAVRVLNTIASLNPKKKKKKNNYKKNNNKKKRKNGENGASLSDNENDDNKNSNGTKSKKEVEESSSLPQQDFLEIYSKSSNLRPFRKALVQCYENVHKRTMFVGYKDEEDYYKKIKEERSLKRQKMAESAQQQKYIADTALRRGRIAKLTQLKADAQAEEEAKFQVMSQYMIPDGHIETKNTKNNVLLLENNKKKDEDDKDNNVKTTISDPNKNKITVETATNEEEERYLPKLRSCYVCKVRYRKLHHFYDQLCPNCAELNWNKRHCTVDLSNKVAIVTGSRVKIGYQTCLKLLRCRCTVIATTRFPNSAAATYRKEHDFMKWKDRLQIYGLDLRDITGIEAFVRFLATKYGTIDILINNACQTVRRPRGYYIPLVQQEQKLWEEATSSSNNNENNNHQKLLSSCIEFEDIRRQLVLSSNQDNDNQQTIMNGGPSMNNNYNSGQQQKPKLMLKDDQEEITKDNSKSNTTTKNQESTSSATTTDTALTVSTEDNNTIKAPFRTTGISHSAAMSQMILLDEDVGISPDILPPGISDINGQQLDLRRTNSWLLKMEDVSTPEIMECMFINAIAPFVLNSKIVRNLMTTTTATDSEKPSTPRFIINVSAMEGKFYRYKMPNHPHTNMAKAALNMMTRTAAEELATKHNIYMNSVDTGWINDENPLEKASKIATNNKFQTPIDEIDAAARIVDPIFVGMNKSCNSNTNNGKDDGNDNSLIYGKFLKDYRETEW